MKGRFAALEMGDPLWNETVAGTNADVFYRPEFCRFRLEGTRFRPLMLRYEDDDGVVFDVTVVKEISALPFFPRMGESFERPPVDLASVEYNGPVIAAAPEQQLPIYLRYREAVDEYCRRTGVVTEFVRIHPLSVLAGLSAAGPGLTKAGEVIYVDLRQGYEAAAGGYDRGHRRSLKRAALNNVEIRFPAPEGPALDTFTKMYLDTMARNEARSAYFHQLDYFQALFKHLGERAMLVEALCQGKVASSTIYLLGSKYAWAYYAGTDRELLSSGAHILLTDRVIHWSAARKFEFLILGGGFKPGDGLYDNKLRFSRLMAPQYHIRKIHDPRMLDRLEAAKAGYDQSLGKITKKDYFPSYWLD